MEDEDDDEKYEESEIEDEDNDGKERSPKRRKLSLNKQSPLNKRVILKFYLN
jgi:hypothetical protein